MNSRLRKVKLSHYIYVIYLEFLYYMLCTLTPVGRWCLSVRVICIDTTLAIPFWGYSLVAGSIDVSQMTRMWSPVDSTYFILMVGVVFLSCHLLIRSSCALYILGRRGKYFHLWFYCKRLCYLLDFETHNGISYKFWMYFEMSTKGSPI